MKLTKFSLLHFLIISGIRRSIYNVLGFADKKVLKQANLISILAYHSVADDDWKYSINLKTIKKQINYLKKNYQFISLKTLEKFINGQAEINTPSIILTFDDGYKDVLSLKDFFSKNNIKPAIFVLADSQHVNNKEIGHQSTFLSKTEIKSLIKQGWEIGCHSSTHADLASLNTKQLMQEIVIAKQSLEKSLGVKINYFAYPKGKYSKNVLRVVKNAKYRLGLTMDDGFIKPGNNPLTIPRIGIDRTHSFAEFQSTFSVSVIRIRKVIKNTFVGRYL